MFGLNRLKFNLKKIIREPEPEPETTGNLQLMLYERSPEEEYNLIKAETTNVSQLNDKQFKYLKDKNYSGCLTDMKAQFRGVK
jgi:hypothetical protein